MSSLVELEIRYQRLVAEREALGARYEAGDKGVLPQIQDLNSQIRATLTQLDSLKAVASSGTVVRDDQAARVDRSNPIDPVAGELVVKNGRIQTSPDTSSGSNATKNKLSDINGFGTDAELRPYSQTQGTSVGNNQISSGPVREDAYTNASGGTNNRQGTTPNGTPIGLTAGVRPGVGAASDDRGNANDVVSSLNAIDWSDKIDPKPNVLDQYASYTYQASLYLMDKASYQRSISTGTKNLANAKLLVQSGGAPQGTGRNDFFNLDYYIDKFEIKSFIAGKAVRLSHNAKEITMTIVEPNGISFVQNLDAAVQQYLGGAEIKKRNFTSQIYLFVVRFYGYDDQGNLVRGGVANNGTSDPNAFVEKWYPIIISKLGFRIANKAVEYEIVCKAPPYQISASSKHGTIPYNVEFSGKTLKDILSGPTTPVTTSAPAKADAATSNKKTVRQSLVTALNEYQQKLRDDGVVQFADEYNIEFVLDSMASATIVNPGLNKSATSMATPGTAADQKLGTKQSMDPNSQTRSATAGMQIVQFIDNLVKSSSYIRDQQTVIVNANNGEETAGPGVNLKNTAWYRIGFKAEPKFDQYDEKRNDYAYKITYTISPYKISQLNSVYFKAPVFNGIHKSYKYWFTGQNTAVLSYEENLNSLYYLILSNTNLGGATSSVTGAQNINELLKYSPQTASGQSTTGAEGRTLEPAANAADQLYNPSDLKECHMSIVGDPAWLAQGEAFSALSSNDTNYFKAFLPDGTINYDSQQILFEVAFNAPRDYNLGTGLMQPSADKLNSTTQLDQVTQTPGTAQFSRIYIAKECISHFVKGKFTQELKGSLMIFYPPGKGEGRPAPQDIRTSSQAGATTITKAIPWQYTRSSVTNPTPTSSLAKGVQQILTPAVQADNPSLSQLQSSPVYIQARKGGATPAAALAAAKASFAAGTNNAANFALPGIRTGPQKIVKDQ
jgi:hypothetical protein